METLDQLFANEQRNELRAKTTRRRIGSELKKLRDKRKMSLREAAEAINKHTGESCDFSTLRKIEEGIAWAEPVALRAYRFYKETTG